MSQTACMQNDATMAVPGERVPNVANRPWRKKFLNHLRKDGNITRAAGLAGITTRQAYRVRKSSERFAKAWDEAIEESDRKTADEFQRRFRHHAKHGYKKAVWYNGKLVGHERKQYPQLLLKGLEAEMRDKYAPRTNTLGASVNVMVHVEQQRGMLADPRMMELQCEMDRLLTQPRALEGPVSDLEAETTDHPSDVLRIAPEGS